MQRGKNGHGRESGGRAEKGILARKLFGAIMRESIMSGGGGHCPGFF